MPETQAELPPRPAKPVPRLIPGKLDIFRCIALLLATFTTIFQIVLIYAPHEAHNDYGSIDTLDPVGFSFYILGGVHDLYMVLIAIYVRHRQNKGEIYCPGYMPHPGYLLFIDVAIMGGCLGWGGLVAAFAILGEDALYAVYCFGLIFVGLSHLKLMIDDCRYVHYRRLQDRDAKIEAVALQIVNAREQHGT